MYHFFPDSECERYHGIVLSGTDLSSLSMIVSGCIHVAADGISLFFLWLSDIPFVYMNHMFFVFSSVDGHSGDFHVMAVF